MSDKKGKEYKVLASEILGCTLASYYNWDNQNRPIIAILEQYFSKDDLQEYIDTGKITRFEKEAVSDLDNELLEKHIAYQLKHKLYTDTQSKFLNWLVTMAGTGLFEKAIVSIQEENIYTKADTKTMLLNQIKGMELSSTFDKVWGNGRKKVASSYINNNLSELECYVWVKYYDIVKEYTKYF